MARLRISPSGPFVENSDGGIAEPGPGFQLRLAEAGGSTGMAALGAAFVDVTDLAGNPYVVTLTTPDPAKRYKFNFHCGVKSVGANSDAELQMMVSYNDGVSYSPIGDNELNLLAAQCASINIDMPMVLGSAIVNGAGVPVPVPAGAPSIKMKVQARSSVAAAIQITNGNSRGTIWLSLAELL